MSAHCSAAGAAIRAECFLLKDQPPGAVSVAVSPSVTSRSAHIPLASLPPTREAMRKLPVRVGANSKLADLPGSSPRDGSGVDHRMSMGEVSCRPLTTEQEL